MMTYADGCFEPAWRDRCQVMAASASKRCGSSDLLYVDLFSRAIDGALLEVDPTMREQAAMIARAWDYATPEEREAGKAWAKGEGLCRHGLDLDCCPRGAVTREPDLKAIQRTNYVSYTVQIPRI